MAAWRKRLRHRAYRIFNVRYRRLAGTLAETQVLLDERMSRADPDATWLPTVQRLLDDAVARFGAGHFDEAWLLLAAARREAVLGLDEAECVSEAVKLRAEADAKLTGWRQRAALELLRSSRWPPSPATLQSVVALLDGRHENVYNRLRIATTQLTVLLTSSAAAVLVIGLLTWAGWIDLFSTRTVRGSFGVVVAVAAFGVLGATLSELLPQRAAARRGQQFDDVLAYRFAVARPVVGATTALVVLVAVTSGITQIVPLTMPGLAILAVGAGFSERLLPGLLGRLAAAARDEEKPAPEVRQAGV